MPLSAHFPTPESTAFRTLEQVCRAGLDIVDVIVQDEYTHDVIVAEGRSWLVFDTT